MSQDTHLVDEELVLRAQAGSRQAFEELIRRHQTKILNLCYRLLGAVGETRELVSDAFAEAFRSLKHFRRESKFETWLYRIALNITFTHLRRRSRERNRFVHEDQASQEEPRQELAVSRSPDPLETLEAEETRNQIRLVLLKLSREHAQILILHDVEELSYEEVAKVLSCPVGTVMSRLSRAREAFRKKWNQLV